MPANRMNRDEFYVAMAPHDDARLRKTSYRRKERVNDLATWHEMLLDRFTGTPEDELLDRLVASPALAGPELIFLRARLAERRGDVSQAAALVTKCLKEMPGRQAYLDFAVKVGAELPSRAREMAAERARTTKYAGVLPSPYDGDEVTYPANATVRREQADPTQAG